jgi:hypothetical protein
MVDYHPMGIEEHSFYLDEFNNLDVAGYAALHPALFAYVKEAMAQPDKQYLLVGDPDHDSESLKNFLGGAPLAALFRHAAIPHVAVETAREMIEQKYLDGFFYHYPQYLHGKFTRQQMEQGRQWLFDRGDEKAVNMKKTLLGFMQAGLRMTSADSNQWRKGARVNAERLFLGDREVAHYIAHRARGEKTGIVYGSGHFYYDGAMASRLGRDKCVHVDIYPDRATYERHTKPQDRKFHPLYVDIMPDKVYILGERSLEDPDPAVYFSATSRQDDVMQQGRDEVAYLYGPNPPLMANFTAMQEYLHPLPGTDPQWFNYVP